MVCGRCGHTNPEGANYCSSCGAPLVDEETTLTLSAVEAADADDDLAAYLEELPPGVGLLVVRHGPNAGSSYRLEDETTTVGRHPDSSIFLDDITVSRRHVTLQRTPGGYVARDAGSLNGTYVNRARVDERVLAHGDELQVGRFRLAFVLGQEERSAGGSR
jgi:pSer/pThr/pTyr-binding forkhead associated (FHA) protein